MELCVQESDLNLMKGKNTMLDLVEKIICEKEIYLDSKNEKRTNIKFFFKLKNGQEIRFEPYYSNFADETKNFNTFGDIYKFLADEVRINDKTKSIKKNEK